MALNLWNFPAVKASLGKTRSRFDKRSCFCCILCGFQPVCQTGWAAQVKNVYYPEVKSLIQRMTSASRVEIIQHNLRKGKIEKGYALLFRPSTKSLGPMPSLFVLVLSQPPSRSLPQSLPAPMCGTFLSCRVQRNVCAGKQICQSCLIRQATPSVILQS